jgi:hypothetical protein
MKSLILILALAYPLAVNAAPSIPLRPVEVNEAMRQVHIFMRDLSKPGVDDSLHLTRLGQIGKMAIETGTKESKVAFERVAPMILNTLETVIRSERSLELRTAAFRAYQSLSNINLMAGGEGSKFTSFVTSKIPDFFFKPGLPDSLRAIARSATSELFQKIGFGAPYLPTLKDLTIVDAYVASRELSAKARDMIATNGPQMSAAAASATAAAASSVGGAVTAAGLAGATLAVSASGASGTLLLTSVAATNQTTQYVKFNIQTALRTGQDCATQGRNCKSKSAR